MATDLLGNKLKVGDWVAQIRQEYNRSGLSAECGIITAIEGNKVQIISAYSEQPVVRIYYDTEENYKKALEKQEKAGFVDLFKRKCDISKVVLTYPDKEQVKNIKKYEKASGKKLVTK